MKVLMSKSDVLALLCALVILAGATANRLTLPKATNAESYHARVRAVAEKIPAQFGNWDSEGTPVPEEAVEELKPNVLISRNYHNTVTGKSVSMLLVQCRDVRDLAPHYPPVCYPGRGLSLTDTRQVELTFGEKKLIATRYSFESTNLQRSGLLQVDNFMILPDGNTRPDMQGMERRIGASQRFFGAAQVQLVHGERGSRDELTAASNSLLESFAPLIDVIKDGDK